MATISSIVFQPLGRSYTDPMGDFIRVPTEEAELVADHGIRGDQKAGGNPTRQINLLTRDWLDRMAAEGYRTGPGEFGEQFILDGIRFEDLQPGIQIALGTGAVIEITKPRTGCDRLQAAQGKSIPAHVLPAIGYLARVVSGGMVRVGDPARILSPERR